eukprot:CAMPEP_0195591354 /NCGR_PEP_ID=MMETSP0814-20130614/34602_1 /TAXON_ID=97485 /ORGANISM="Prymnesium parvum, Strain Texoma1" /LENGTH=181 /DNA_ID=CAMNT_0040730397 /DNA_START=89 /DNA_END=634 /DNA_ORIENTATION=-
MAAVGKVRQRAHMPNCHQCIQGITARRGSRKDRSACLRRIRLRTGGVQRIRPRHSFLVCFHHALEARRNALRVLRQRRGQVLGGKLRHIGTGRDRDSCRRVHHDVLSKEMFRFLQHYPIGPVLVAEGSVQRRHLGVSQRGATVSHKSIVDMHADINGRSVRQLFDEQARVMLRLRKPLHAH